MVEPVGERVRFASSQGPLLAGLLDAPAEPVRGWGVFAHGFALSKDSPAAARACKQLAAEGIGRLRFDNLGLGDSEGTWGDGSFTVKVDDTIKAAEFMAEQGMPAHILIGHSFGGAAVLAAAHRIPSIRAVVTIGAPFERAQSGTEPRRNETAAAYAAHPVRQSHSAASKSCRTCWSGGWQRPAVCSCAERGSAASSKRTDAPTPSLR
jgi:alpha/beta superfamily hydrolase